MNVKMIKTVNGSPDGVTVNRYEAGHEYDIPEDLAAVFLKAKMAKQVKESAAADVPETPEAPKKKTKGKGK